MAAQRNPPQSRTQGERLERVATMLETVIHNQEKTDAKVDEIHKELREDKADLAALKNRGSGLLIGVALAAGGVGAGLTKMLLEWLR